MADFPIWPVFDELGAWFEKNQCFMVAAHIQQAHFAIKNRAKCVKKPAGCFHPAGFDEVFKKTGGRLTLRHRLDFTRD